jgi:hypothetical protein
VRGQGVIGLLAAVMLAGSMWFYVQHVVIREQLANATAHGIPRGNLSDLYPRWLGTRELLLRHRDPYSREITREIQAGYYGRPLDRSHPDDPKDQQGFAYPLYVVFLLAPTITLPFPVVQSGFFWLLVVATLVTILLWLRILQWRPSWATMATLVVMTLGSFQVLQGLKLQQLTLLVSALIAASVALLVAGHLFLAGIVLALATIKPQLIVFLACWIVFWTLSSWRERRNFVFGFLGMLILLAAGAELLMPGWVAEFRKAISEYRQYNDGALSVLQTLISPLLGTVVAALVILVTACLCWRMRQVAADSTAFTWTTTIVLAITILVIPKTSSYNHVLLLPGIMFAARYWRTGWRNSPAARVTLLAAILILFWPWLAAFFLTLIALVAPVSSLGDAWIAPLYTSLATPFAVFAVIAFNLRVLGEPASETKPDRISSP